MVCMPEAALKPLAGAIFLLCYVAIASDRVDKTKVALFGAAAMLTLGVVSQHEAFGHYEFREEIIRHFVDESVSPEGTVPDALPGGVRSLPGADWNTIFLLIGMMIIVGIMRHTGVFEWLAIKCAKAARGDPLRIMILLSVVTAVLSAALDNVTTVLLIAPVTLVIADALGISALPLLIPEILASNIGGTATLIGDPPNIIIGSKAGISFAEFAANLGPTIAIVLVVFLATARLVYRRALAVPEERRAEVMELDETKSITNYRLLWRSLGVMALVLLGFGLHARLGWEPATVALGGGALLLLLSHLEPEEAFREVEWPTIFFFLGLFIMVGGLVKVGLISDLSRWIAERFAGNVPVLASVILWFSAIASAVVDNIPYTMAMAEVVTEMAGSLPQTVPGVGAVHQPAAMAVWWSLALGACLGGNGTLVGASANVVVAGIAQRAKQPIGFLAFLKVGAPLMVQSVLVAWLCLWVTHLGAL